MRHAASGPHVALVDQLDTAAVTGRPIGRPQSDVERWIATTDHIISAPSGTDALDQFANGVIPGSADIVCG